MFGPMIEARGVCQHRFGYVPEYDVERRFREYIEFLETGRCRQLP